MCQFKAFIITQKRIYECPEIDNHEDIIDLYGLKDDPEKIIRAEYIPDYLDIFNFDKWAFKVDQDIIPSWFDPAKKVEIIEEIKTIVSTYFLQKDTKILVGGTWIIQNCKVSRICGMSRIISIGDSASVEYIGGSASVEYIGGSASVGYIGGSASVEYIGDSASVGYIGDSAKIINDYRKGNKK